MVNKSDQLWEEGSSLKDLKARISQDLCRHMNQEISVYFSSCKDQQGIADLSNALEKHLALYQKERWHKNAKVFTKRLLQPKKKKCQALIDRINIFSTMTSLVNNKNTKILRSMINKIRQEFGLTKAIIKQYQNHEQVGSLATQLMQYDSKKGIQKLLAKSKKHIMLKKFVHISFLNIVLERAINLQKHQYVAKQYINQCYKLANFIISEPLQNHSPNL